MFEINKMPLSIDIGYTGEKNFRTIQIDMSAWMALMPDGVPSIIHIRPGEDASEAYVAATEFDENILSWTITDGDVGENGGEGTAQIWLEEENEEETIVKRGKSVTIKTIVHESANEASDTPPEPQEAWITQMTALKVATVEAADDAENSAEDAEDSAEDSEAYAVGTRNGTDVTSGDPTYHNNSKYYSGLAKDAKDDAVSAKTDAVSAKSDAEAAKAAAEAALAKYPYVDTVSGNWMVWDPEDNQWKNTGVHAKGDTGAVPNIQIGTVTTLLPSQSATVERRSGSPDTAPVFDFGIPKGDTGTAENIYGNTIEMSQLDSTKVATAIEQKLDKANVYNGVDKTASGYALDARIGKVLNDSANSLRKGMMHVAKLSSGDWILNSGDDAAIGDILSVNGTVGVATAAITGGSTVLVKNTNWVEVAGGTLNKIILDKANKVAGAVSGNFAGLDANGNLTDSGSKSSDFLAAGNVYNGLDQTVSGYALDARQGKALSDQLANYHLVRCEYIEAAFSNGYAEYDLTSKLSAVGMSKAGAPIVTISGSAAQAAPCVRACDMASNNKTLKIALTTTYSGTVGCFVHFRAYN